MVLKNKALDEKFYQYFILSNYYTQLKELNINSKKHEFTLIINTYFWIQITVNETNNYYIIISIHICS